MWRRLETILDPCSPSQWGAPSAICHFRESKLRTSPPGRLIYSSQPPSRLPSLPPSPLLSVGVASSPPSPFYSNNIHCSPHLTPVILFWVGKRLLLLHLASRRIHSFIASHDPSTAPQRPWSTTTTITTSTTSITTTRTSRC